MNKTPEKPPCKHKWFLNKNESVFGLTRVNAVLDCKVCKQRKGPPEIMSWDRFKVTGDKVRTYWLKDETE